MPKPTRTLFIAVFACLAFGVPAQGVPVEAKVGAVSVNGLASVPEGTVREAISTASGKVFDPGAVQEDAKTIEDILGDAGRPASKVKAETYEAPNGRVAVRFDVDEGQAAPVGGIQIVGNYEFTDEEVEAQMRTRVPGVLSSLVGDAAPFDPVTLLGDLKRIRRFYVSEGFLDFRVVSSVSEYDRVRGMFYVNVLVSEGDRRGLGPLASAD